MLAVKKKHFDLLSAHLESEDRLTLCAPLVVNWSLWLIVLRDTGDTLFEAQQVTLQLYHVSSEEWVERRTSVNLRRNDLKKGGSWPETIRKACRKMCGDPKKLDELRAPIVFEREVNPFPREPHS